MRMECTCDDYAENIKLLTQNAMFLKLHHMGEYEGKVFVFCPWCGQRLNKSIRKYSIESLADRYDREARTLSQEEYDALYDDDYFEAMKVMGG